MLRMDADHEWLTPRLSLESEARMQIELAQLRSCNEAQLLISADELLRQWYQHRQVINNALQQIQKLKIELLLADAPVFRPASPDHHAWAAELYAQRSSSS
jgi:hypothetical protein